MADETAARSPDQVLLLHPLVYASDGDEVTIGRPDTDSYGIFPSDGAELVRRIEEGMTLRQATDWYDERYGESVDIADLVEALDELGFVRAESERPAETIPVRWRRLGAALFSPPAFLVYTGIVLWAALAVVRNPDLAPSYRNVFFTDYFMIIQLTLFFVMIPLLLVHEGFHALAARRLGLRTRLRISHRFYFLVLETSLDGLVAVPRAKRYLPILAGLIADLVCISAFTIAANALRDAGAALTLAGRLCLAIAFTALLRLVWQFFLYLRTDLYVLVNTALGCVNLHQTATRLLSNRINRLLGRRHRLIDESDWHPVDRKAAGWYSWLIAAGYVVSAGTFAVVLLPMTYQFGAGVVGRVAGGEDVSLQQQVDAIVFGGLSLLQLGFVGWLALRDRLGRRQERGFRHLIT